jgi:hypothetical protein
MFAPPRRLGHLAPLVAGRRLSGASSGAAFRQPDGTASALFKQILLADIARDRAGGTT